MISKKMVFKYSSFVAIFCCIILVHTVSRATEICEVRLDCPGNYDTDTLELPDNIVMLSKAFRHCAPTYVREGVALNSVDTISLFFLIDHSASMQTNDPNSNRYIVAARIIDSLRLKSNASEVGIAIFSNQLMHNYKIDSYAKQLFPANGWTDSYVPLTRLDSQVNGQSAVDYLKSVIALGTEKDIGGNLKLVNGYYGASGRHDGHENLEHVLTSYNGTTDISLAFEAALAAFKTAKYPRNKQYIVFLSDGEAQFVDLERRQYINDFINGKGVPTTLTAWINKLQPVPDQIIRMTQNISGNGYSETNKMSNVWKSSGDEGDLLSHLLKVTQSGGFAVIPSHPVRMSINGISATRFDDSLAYFPANVVFNPSTTTLDISFTYHYEFPWDIDSSKNYKVVISSKPGVPIPAEVSTYCWEQGRIGFYVNGTEVTGVIQDDQKLIEVRYYPSVNIVPSNVVLTIRNQVGDDQFQLPASYNNSYFTATFKRETGPAKSDGIILQNNDNDSIIALYTNPDIPLDIVREARRVGPARDIIPLRAWYLDQNADGYPDIIRVTQGKDRFSQTEATSLKQYIYATSSGGSRSITVNDVMVTSSGFDVIISPGAGAGRFTGIYTNERVNFRAVPGLTGGGSLPATSVVLEDSMAPVIVSATFISRTRPVGGDDKFNDTLDITFSENVRTISGEYPFKYLNQEMFQQYTMSLASLLTNKEKQRFLVNAISGTNSNTPDKPGVQDSIWIDETANVSDENGRAQINPGNTRTVIQKKKIRYTFTAIVCPTPADPRNARIPLPVLQGFENVIEQEGIVIMVTPGQQIAVSDNVTATISIYDQLGLPVVKDDVCKVSSAKDKLIYIWNGANNNGRIVGNGIYPAVVHITVGNGAKETIKMKIGVLHEKK